MQQRDVNIRNFICLEVLRAYMAWWVVFDHGSRLLGAGFTFEGNETPLIAALPPIFVKLLTSGPTAVHVFMILSGFVITNLLHTKQEQYGPYLLRRAFRLFPIYLFCLAAAVFALHLRQYAYIDNPHAEFRMFEAVRAESEQDYFASHLTLHLTLLHGLVPENILPGAAGSILLPAWSLSLEWQFYLIAPYLVTAVLRGSWFVRCAIVAGLVAAQILFRQHFGHLWELESFIPLVIGYFLVGILSYVALDSAGKDAKTFWGAICGCAVIAIFLDKIADVIWAVWFGILLVESGVIAVRSGPVVRLLDWFAFAPRLARLGRWSYSTYLIHMPVYCIVVGAYASSVGPTHMHPAALAVLMVCCWPITLAVSGLLYRWVEMPGIRQGRVFARAIAERSEKTVV